MSLWLNIEGVILPLYRLGNKDYADTSNGGCWYTALAILSSIYGESIAGIPAKCPESVDSWLFVKLFRKHAAILKVEDDIEPAIAISSCAKASHHALVCFSRVKSVMPPDLLSGMKMSTLAKRFDE